MSKNGVSGSFKLSSTNGSGYIMKIHYMETYDEITATSTLTITGAEVCSSRQPATGATHYLNGDISIVNTDGSNEKIAVTMDSFSGTHCVNILMADASASEEYFYPVCLGDETTAPNELGFVDNITHNNDGNKSIKISVNITAYINSSTIAWQITGDTIIDLTQILRGLVYIDNGSGFDAYQCYVDNGSTWDLCVPYIDNGITWDLCS